MKTRLLAATVIAVSLLSCSDKSRYQKTDDGIVVHLDGATKAVRLQVVSDNIIRVTATPTDSIPILRSMAVLPDLKLESSWKVEELKSELILATASIRAHISLDDGRVWFTDLQGMPLLQEKSGTGRSFVSTSVEGQSSYNVQQVFESSNDEAFYGLGAHQNGQMNYKGQDVELAQHNIVDVVPFLYSNKNYGILWDNYSISKFGDPRSYESLNSLTLFDREGNPGGLTATYYVKDQVKEVKSVDKIEYEFLETPEVESFPKDVSRSGKVLYEGSFTSDAEGIHKFLTYSSGYLKIWIDDSLVIDKWRQNWNPWTNKFNVNVKKGDKHSIRIDWIPSDAGYFSIRHLDPYPVDEQQRLTLSSEYGDAIDYYFIKGNNADEVISGYRSLTGKAPIVPLWAMGFWQSRERYRSQKELLDVVKEYRKRKLPLDNIVLDWQYWEDPKWGSHEFDPKRFPDPQGMINELHDLHTHLMVSVWPKFDIGTPNYEEMKQHGFLFMRNIEKQRKDWVGAGYQNTFYDPFNPDAGKLFWKQIDKQLNSKQVDAWWLDATEPDMHSNLSIDERKLNMSPTAIGPGAKYFNAYSLMNAKSVYEGQRLSSPGKRVFILTRSAFAGQQRYGAVTWSGDIVSRWSDFKDQIAAGINFSLSGIPYWTMDIGGFAVESRYYNATGENLNEWRELNTRWFQFGAFCPVFRSHGQFPFREIYNVAETGSPEYKSMEYYDKMRYRLLPYIYSLAGKSYFDDYTIMRGLVMDFNGDKNTHIIGDQYMFGPSLLVCPVSEYKARERQVYLPANTGWYDFYTGAYHAGGKTTTAVAPLDRLPLYVKAGSVIPAGQVMQYTTEKTNTPLTLYVYGGADGAFTWYEDEGTNYNYEKEKYARVEISYSDKEGILSLGKRQHSFDGMQSSREVQVIYITKDNMKGIDLEAVPDQTVTYTGESLEIDLKH